MRLTKWSRKRCRVDARGHFHSGAVHDGQCSRKSRDQWVHKRVWIGAIKVHMGRIGRAREHFAARAQLHMNLQSNNQSGLGDGTLHQDTIKWNRHA